MEVGDKEERKGKELEAGVRSWGMEGAEMGVVNCNK